VIWDFSIFLIYALMAINFPLWIAFAVVVIKMVIFRMEG
jgi:hypothetical protein